MRILVTAASVMLCSIFAVPALALDDTPTQTPYLNIKVDQRADDNRAPPAVRPPAALRRTELAELRRPLRPTGMSPAIAIVPPVLVTQAPLESSLPAAGQAPGSGARPIGLR